MRKVRNNSSVILFDGGRTYAKYASNNAFGRCIALYLYVIPHIQLFLYSTQRLFHRDFCNCFLFVYNMTDTTITISITVKSLLYTMYIIILYGFALSFRQYVVTVFIIKYYKDILLFQYLIYI